MRYLTDFADQAVILPLVLAVGVALAILGWRRGALAWFAVVGATFLTMLAGKLIFLGCAPLFGRIDVHSPSGHTAAATIVSGGLTLILTRRRASVLPVALLGGTVIGISRVVLHMHSLPEALIGGAIGLLGALALARCAGTPPSRLRVGPLAVVIVVVAAIFHGLHLPAEPVIRHTAFELGRFIPVCHAQPGLAHEPRLTHQPLAHQT